jgi:O-antigen/teichoic acid export membrane protein
MSQAAGAAAPRAGARRALGALILSGSNIIRLGIQLAMLPILARLVGPSEYGIVALAVPLVLFCNMLADGGLGQALARRREVPPDLESTVFWLAGAIGAGLAAAACLLAWPAAALFKEPRLAMLIVALSPILVMSGFTAAANARVIREGRFGVFASGDLISVTVSSAAAVGAAVAGWGAWSLVAQQLALWTCKFLWVGSLSGVQVRRACRPALARDLLRFGRDTIGANVADFVTRNAANFLVGGALGSLALGWYAMAYQIARIPDLVISGPVGLYVFTAVARVAEEGRAAARDLGRATVRLAAAALAPIFCGLALVSDVAVDLVLGPKWSPAAPVLAVLCAAGFAFSLCYLIAALFMGLGRSELQLRLAILAGIATAVGVALAAPHGLLAAAWSVASVTCAVAVAYLLTLSRALGLPLGVLLASAVPAATGALALTAAVLGVRKLAGDAPDLLLLPMLVLAGMAAYGAVLGLLFRRPLRADLRICLAAHGEGG